MTTFIYRKQTVLDLRLRLLDYATGADCDAYEDVLVTLGTGVRKVAERLERAPADDDAFIQDETQIIENMLGAAFVVCQGEITSVVQAALRVDDAAKVGIFPSARKTNRESQVRALGPTFNGTLSQIEVLWHLGNYFKHREEWDPLDWEGSSKFTLAAIKAAGLESPTSSYHLRQGAEALGNTAYDDMDVFQEIIRHWSSEVRKHIRGKLGRI